MTWLIVGLALLAMVLLALVDLFVLHRGIKLYGPDREAFWIRPRSLWNLLSRHEGLTVGSTIHVRLRDPKEAVHPEFVSHEWRHISQQRGDVLGIGAPPVAFVFKYLTDAAFVAEVEEDAVAFGANNTTNPFWVGVAGVIQKAQGA